MLLSMNPQALPNHSETKEKVRETKKQKGKKVRTWNHMLHNCSREETGEGLTPSASVTEG